MKVPVDVPAKTGKGVLKEEVVDQLGQVDEQTGDEVEKGDDGDEK